MHELRLPANLHRRYKQTTATFRKQLVKRSSNEFKKSFAYIDAGTELAEILRYKKDGKKRGKKTKVNKFANTLPPKVFAKFKKYRGLKVKRRKEESSDEEEESAQTSTKDDGQSAANVASSTEIKSDQGEAKET